MGLYREDYELAVTFELRTEIDSFTIFTFDFGYDIENNDFIEYTYQTNIFRKNNEPLEYRTRYRTKEEAIDGHNKAIKYIKSLLSEIKN